jgi:hypothetical protein
MGECRLAFLACGVGFGSRFSLGNPLKGVGEGAYGLSPSILLSHEFARGRYQAFSTVGFNLVLARRRLDPAREIPHHEVFMNSGFSARLGRGWSVAEFSVSNNSWSGGEHTDAAITPSYTWRLARRTELLMGVPIGVTSSADRVGGVVKFTFELGGKEAK